MAEEITKESLPAALGRPVDVTIGDQTFRMSPLTLNDYADFEQRIKANRLTATLEGFRNAKGLLSQEEESLKGEIIRALLQDSLAGSDFLREFVTVNGALYALWLSFRHEHPDLTLAKLAGHIKNYEEALDIATKLSGLDEGEDEDPPVRKGEQNGST